VSTADFAFTRQREDHEQAAKRELLRPHVKVPITAICDSAEVLRSNKARLPNLA